MHTLIDALKQHQEENNLSDGKLAALLGIHRSTLSYVKSGRREPGIKVLISISRKIPDLKPLVADYINGNNTKEH